MTVATDPRKTGIPNAPFGAPLAAAIGDSITAANTNWTDSVTPANLLTGAAGYGEWASVLCKQRVQLPYNYSFGYPSQETSVVLSNLPKVLALNPRPSVVYVECGTNNINNSGAYSAITTDLAAIAAGLLQAGIRVIFLPILPRTAFTQAQGAIAERVNRWMLDFSLRAAGWVAVAGYMPSLSSTASTTWGAATNVLYDGIHPSIKGAFYMGKAIAQILNVWFPPVDILPTNSLVYDATNNPNGNKLASPQFASSGGTVTPAAAGVSPSGWTLDLSGGGSVVTTGSLVTATDGALLHQQVISAGPYTSTGSSSAPDYTHLSRLFQSISAAKLPGSETIRAACYVEVDAGASNIAVPTLQLRWGGSSAFNASLWPSQAFEMPSEAWSGVLLTPPHTFTTAPAAGDVVMFMNTYFAGSSAASLSPSGTVRFGRPAVFAVGTENASLTA